MKFKITVQDCPVIFYQQKRTLDQDLSQALDQKDSQKVADVFGEILLELNRDQINDVSEAQKTVDLQALKQ